MNPIVYAIPAFIVFMVLEIFSLRFLQDEHEGDPGHSAPSRPDGSPSAIIR